MASTLMIAERLLLINSQKEIYKALGLSGGRGGGRENAGKGKEQSESRGLMDTSAIIRRFIRKKEKKKDIKNTPRSCTGAEMGGGKGLWAWGCRMM